MNRGSSGTSMLSVPPANPFNEAPIHESGKFMPKRGNVMPEAPFNEAPIHESGKWYSDGLLPAPQEVLQ